MAGLDASTSAAVAALVVAVLALVVASAQALQQFLITGQLIRLCDSVVYGPLPGQGRRVWQLSQFRFRVLYSIPNISLESDLWPLASPHVQSYSAGMDPLPRLSRPDLELTDDDSSISKKMYLRGPPLEEGRWWRRIWSGPKELMASRTGEASWVSFSRAVELHCGESIRVDSSEHDADRCPADMPTAPMQVSMRDVAVMGLMSGMEVTQCSFDDKSLSMQGQIGTITSAVHPILGPILHFEPRDIDMRRPGALGAQRSFGRGRVELRWMCRTWDVCTVAGEYYNSGHRRTVRRLDDRWLEEQRGAGWADLVPNEQEAQGKPGNKPEKHKEPNRKLNAKMRVPSGEAEYPRQVPQDGHWMVMDLELPDSPGEPPRRKPPPKVPTMAYIVDPDSPVPWHAQPQVMVFQGRVIDAESNFMQAPPSRVRLTTSSSRADASSGVPRARRQTTVEDVEDEGEPASSEVAQDLAQRMSITTEDELPPPSRTDKISEPKPLAWSDATNERVEMARARQAARSAKLKAIKEDKALVGDSVRRGAMPSPYQTTLLLTNHAHNETAYQNEPHDQEDAEPTSDEEAARQREQERHTQRKQRDDERTERYKIGTRVATLWRMDMFWFSQMDVFQGFWATPWPQSEQMPVQASLVGAVTVILECLLGFLPDGALLYTGQSYTTRASFQETAYWLFAGNRTYPAYALNARGGVIASGVYQKADVPVFRPHTIPVLELLHSYDWQVEAEVRNASRYVEELNVELMRLDSWLSYVGRLSLVADGPNRLLKQTPALVDLLREEFWLDFQHIDLSAQHGGLQEIQGLAANVMDWMMDEELTEPEQLYLLVASLRAFKVAQAVLAGADTRDLRSILLKDVQVHLV